MPFPSHRHTRQLLISTALLCLLAMSATGCTTKPVPEATTITTKTPTTSPTPSYAPDEQEAINRATEYNQTLFAIKKDSDSSTDPLAKTSRDKGYEYAISMVMAHRMKKRKVVGDIALAPFSVKGVGPQQKIVLLCIDSTNSDALDAEGKSLITPGTYKRDVGEFTMSFEDSQWFVTDVNWKGQTC